MTTFINKTSDQGILFELKEMLVQTGQSVPSFLQVLRGPEGEKIRCNYCGSSQHTGNNCLKIEKEKLRKIVGESNEN